MVSLTRRYPFSASHRLHSDALSASENAQLYGKCNNPYGHGHDYVLGVTVSGQVDTETGLILPLARLDELVDTQVLRIFRFANVNLDIPQFVNLVPTTENIVAVITTILMDNWSAYLGETAARLTAVRIQETPRNGFIGFVGRGEMSGSRSDAEEVHAQS
jgi:6-pyruvoyltetrahydropterin/6-carboxytetrahydropterin synthase